MCIKLTQFVSTRADLSELLFSGQASRVLIAAPNGNPVFDGKLIGVQRADLEGNCFHVDIMLNSGSLKIPFYCKD